mmetsp:Transcript_30947/g.89106  ORF Transcript_30947/g.89106 Transcript_30947/m.89106 type:complete len:264 (-) Transcript_30947:8-799(-)
MTSSMPWLRRFPRRPPSTRSWTTSPPSLRPSSQPSSPHNSRLWALRPPTARRAVRGSRSATLTRRRRGMSLPRSCFPLAVLTSRASSTRTPSTHRPWPRPRARRPSLRRPAPGPWRTPSRSAPPTRPPRPPVRTSLLCTAGYPGCTGRTSILMSSRRTARPSRRPPMVPTAPSSPPPRRLAARRAQAGARTRWTSLPMLPRVPRQRLVQARLLQPRRTCRRRGRKPGERADGEEEGGATRVLWRSPWREPDGVRTRVGARPTS